MTTLMMVNRTGKGNVYARRIEMEEMPHSQAGVAHVRIINVFRDGSENTRDGKYFPSREAAETQFAEWVAGCEKAGMVRE